MKQVFIIIASLFLTQTLWAQSINTKASKVRFEVSNMGKTVEGTILNVKGTVYLDEGNLGGSTFEATVDPRTINTGSKGRDKHLHKDDFFGIATFPEIKMVSKSITKTDMGYQAEATLTIRDVSMDVVIPFTAEHKDNQLHMNGNLTVQRKDFKLGEKMGEGSIGLDVKVFIEVVVDEK